ncbi:MAG TPA: AraC family transcriptional regulator, partial [Tepidisphaeraceae bacterium]|nr:AraC family transcriptional regulator [Tepidisphaeraceae bacterium]
AGLSPYHFHRLFRETYGKTLKRVNTELQIDFAKRLLLEGVSTVEVGQRAGFANQSHFTSRFKSITGLPPAAWLRANAHNIRRSSSVN